MRRTIELDQGWTLYRSSDDFQVGKAVRVPHDAMLSEERSAQAVTGNAGAYFPGGTYRYERVIDVDPKWADKVVTLELEGVYQKASVLVDGTEVAHNDYGYTGFYVNLTPHLTPGGRNVLTVVADNSHQPNSRWYSGSGMYRPARLYVQEQDHIALGGVRITTESTEVAQVHVLTQLEGEGDVLVSVWRDGVKVAAGQGTDVVLAIPDARLWSAEEPNLYECRVSLRWGRAVVDEERLAFGIRDVTWGSFGLRVNGREVLLRGGCVHHTQGILGAAEPAEAAWREVALLKEHGFNAIRSAHNPISKAMLDACDHLGMYVMDEFADMWFEHKNPCDYASDFETSWEADLAAMVRKDMSHPSVLMYSIGNENAEPRDERGVACARMLAERVHELDPSRPVTAGVNPTILFATSLGMGSFNGDGKEGEQAGNADGGVGGNASLLYNTYVSKMGQVMDLISRTPMVGAANAPFFDCLDLAGYNYASGRYRSDLRRNPSRPVMGSETMPYDLARNWRLVEGIPQVVGDFMWTAIDYLGECSLAGWSDDPDPVNKPFPWLCADTGALDLIGNPNGEGALADVVWGVADLLLYVRPCTLPHPVKAPWRGTNSVPCWSWRGCTGTPTVVEVYTRAPFAKLYLNGRHVGTKRVRDCLATFKVNYDPGTLVALACDRDGHTVGRADLRSAGEPVGLRLTREPRHMPGQDGSGSVVFVDVCACDPEGIVEGGVDREVSVSVEGGELLSFGSAAQKSERSYLEGTFSLRHGRALAVVRLGEGPCILRAQASGLLPAELTL